MHVKAQAYAAQHAILFAALLAFGESVPVRFRSYPAGNLRIVTGVIRHIKRCLVRKRIRSNQIALAQRPPVNAQFSGRHIDQPLQGADRLGLTSAPVSIHRHLVGQESLHPVRHAGDSIDMAHCAHRPFGDDRRGGRAEERAHICRAVNLQREKLSGVAQRQPGVVDPPPAHDVGNERFTA